MRKLNLLILVLISSFTAMRAVTSEKDLWQLHTSDIHADYVGAPKIGRASCRERV